MNSFSKLLEQARTDKERQKLLDVRKSSGMDDDDPLWTFVWLAELMVQRMVDAAETSRKAAEAAAQASAARARELVTKTITSQVDMAVFNETLKRNALMVIGGTLGLMAIGWIAVTIVFAGINERTMGRLAERVVGLAKQEMVEGINATVASKVANIMNTGVEHQTEIVDLLRLEEAASGTIQFALSEDGQFMRRMYNRNNHRTCNSRGPMSGFNACINIAPVR